MRVDRGLAALLAAVVLAGCGTGQDAVMWDCQLEAQKANAGKSSEAAGERGEAIEACMRARGYALDTRDAACRRGSVKPGCYRAR